MSNENSPFGSKKKRTEKVEPTPTERFLAFKALVVKELESMLGKEQKLLLDQGMIDLVKKTKNWEELSYEIDFEDDTEYYMNKWFGKFLNEK